MSILLLILIHSVVLYNWDIDEANYDEEGGTARKGARKKKKNEPVKSIRTAHPTNMYFHPGGKGEGKNRYAVIGMMEGFDMTKSLKENDPLMTSGTAPKISLVRW